MIYDLEKDFNSAYSYVLIPKVMKDSKVELRKCGKFDVEYASNAELDLTIKKGITKTPFLNIKSKFI